MAPLPSNNTSVLFVDYSSCGQNHTLQCRYNSPETFTTAMSTVSGFLTALGSQIQLLTILGARYRLVGTNVTIATVWTGLSTYGSGAGTAIQGAWFFDFVGRSLAGRRVRVSVFGAGQLNEGVDYRAQPGEIATLDAAISVLASASNRFVAIDGASPVWKAYTNTGANAYWRNKIRN